MQDVARNRVRLGASARCGHTDHNLPQRGDGVGRLVAAVGGRRSFAVIWGSSDTPERAPRHFLYFSLRHEPSHVALQPTAIDAGPLP
jgi:hypothetical protein